MTTTPNPLQTVDPSQPPVISGPASSVDVSSINPNPAQPSQQTAALGSAQQSLQESIADRKSAADTATAPLPSTGYTGPHAKLLAMVQGLAIGMSNFGTSVATGGKEGGVAGVLADEGQIQNQRIQRQQAAQEQRDAAVRTKLTAADTAYANAQNYMLLASMPSDLERKHIELQSAQQGVIGQAQDIRTKALQDFTMTGDMNAYNDTLQKLGAASGAPGSAPTAGAPAVTIPPTAIATWKNATDSALSAYPNDPEIKAYAAVLADPNSAPTAMAMAGNGAKNRMNALDAGAESRTKQGAAAAVDRPKDLNDATGRLSQAQQAYAANPSPATKLAVDNAKVAQTSFLNADRQQKQIAQDIQNGDPAVIGAALANGVYAPSQVLSARSMSKPFYSKVVAAANDAAKANGAPEILGPNGQHTGAYFNAATAEAQYKYSTNVQTQNTLNKILTLNEPGGDLDILKDATTALPKMDSKTLNKIFNAGATEFGSPEATNFHMALYNLASLLAQVQTGGIPTEGEIQNQLDLMSAANSKGQLDGAFQIARRDIAARGTSMVANNPYLRAAYPNLLSASSGKSVSLAAAMALPINKGKTESQVRADIIAHGHQVGE